jgi:hypothetical protein
MQAIATRLPRCLLLLMLIATPAAARPMHEQGVAYGADGQVRYREDHWLEEGRRLVIYRCPDGRPFARKHVRDASAAPSFDFVDARFDLHAGVRDGPDGREVFGAMQGQSAPASALKPAPNQVIDAGFNTYVQRYWDALLQGDRREVAFLLVARRRNLALRIEPGPAHDGLQPFRLVMDAWYGGLAPTLQLSYAVEDRRLVRFEGISDIRDDKGGYQKVRIEFPRHAPGAATAIERQQAEQAPLVRHCGVGASPLG